MLGNFRFKVFAVDVAFLIGLHNNHLQASHDSASRVSAVGGNRDQAHVAMTLVDGVQVRPDGFQSSEFALSTRLEFKRKSDSMSVPQTNIASCY